MDTYIKDAERAKDEQLVELFSATGTTEQYPEPFCRPPRVSVCEVKVSLARDRV